VRCLDQKYFFLTTQIFRITSLKIHHVAARVRAEDFDRPVEEGVARMRPGLSRPRRI